MKIRSNRCQCCVAKTTPKMENITPARTLLLCATKAEYTFEYEREIMTLLNLSWCTGSKSLFIQCVSKILLQTFWARSSKQYKDNSTYKHTSTNPWGLTFMSFNRSALQRSGLPYHINSDNLSSFHSYFIDKKDFPSVRFFARTVGEQAPERILPRSLKF